MVDKLQRMSAGQQASVRLTRVEAESLLVFLRVEAVAPLHRFVEALKLAAAGQMDRQSVDFMVDELIRSFQK